MSMKPFSRSKICSHLRNDTFFNERWSDTPFPRSLVIPILHLHLTKREGPKIRHNTHTLTKDEKNTPSADEIQMGEFALGILSHSNRKTKGGEDQG